MIIADILLLIVLMVALIIASLIDFKTKEVPDWLNFSLIAIALGIRLMYAIVYSEWSYFLYGLLGFGAMFVLGMFIFYTKQWGGGDTKLLMGLGAVFGTKPFFVGNVSLLSMDIPFLAVLLINLLFVGAIYGLVWSVYLFVKNRKEVIKEFRVLMRKKIRMLVSHTLIGVVLLLLFSFDRLILTFLPIVAVYLFLAIAVFFIFYPYLYLTVKSIEIVGMLKWIPPSRLVEGDWVAKEVKYKGKVLCSPKDLGLEKYQIEALKKAKIKKVLIKDGIAFVPSIFLGTVLTLIYGNILFIIP